MEKKKYPVGAKHYELYEEIGQGASASVYRAMCIPNKEIVAIKVLDFECANSDLNKISREAQTMTLVDHPNVLKSHCSFVNDHNLWVVMPFMPGGSCLHILKSAHPEGFEEVVIATILREALKALVYLHRLGIMHRDVKAGNILICDRGSIKLGDLGVSACLYDSGDRQHLRNTFVGTPCWMAPEVMEHKHGYDLKADIWSFGITAVELAHGHAPFSKYPPMKVLLMTLQNAPPGLDYERDKKFSKVQIIFLARERVKRMEVVLAYNFLNFKSFKQMIASCLVKDPSKRPSAGKLLKNSFFKQAKSDEFLARKLLKGLPTLGDRLQALKKKEEDMLVQKKIPDGQKEEMSQNEYKRGISCWNFDLEDLKAQASLIHDEESIAEKDQLRSSSSSEETVVDESELPNQLSYMNEILKAAGSSVDTVVGESEFPNQLSYMTEVTKAAGSSVETVVGESGIPNQLSYMTKVSKAAGSSVEPVVGESEFPNQLSYMTEVTKAAGSSVETVVGESGIPSQSSYMNVVSKSICSSVETVFGESEDQLSYMNEISKAAGSSLETVFGESKDQLSYMNEVSKAAGSSVETVFGKSKDQLSYMNKVTKAVCSSIETVVGESEDQLSYMNEVLKAAGSSVETVVGESEDQLSYMNEVLKAAGSSVETVVGESEFPYQLSYMKKVSKAANVVCQ